MVTAGILLFRKNSHGRAGNRTRDFMIISQRLWPLDKEAGLILKVNMCKWKLIELDDWLLIICLPNDDTSTEWERQDPMSGWLKIEWGEVTCLQCCALSDGADEMLHWAQPASGPQARHDYYKLDCNIRKNENPSPFDWIRDSQRYLIAAEVRRFQRTACIPKHWKAGYKQPCYLVLRLMEYDLK